MRVAMTVVLCVVLVLGITALASAQMQNSRVLAMGEADVGLATDAGAYLSNPAGLPTIQADGMGISPWPSRGSLTVGIDNAYDSYTLQYSARDRAATTGWGGGYSNIDSGETSTDVLGAGYGMRFSPALCGGVSVIHMDNGDDTTLVNLGAMYEVEGALNAWRAGVLLQDLTDEAGNGVIMDVGASVDTPAGVIVSAEISDLTDEVDTIFNIGAEYELPLTDLTVRAGAADGDLTLGAAYKMTNLKLGFAWQDTEGDDEFFATLGGSF